MKIKTDHLITCYLEGTLTPSETDLFFLWLEEDPKNKEQFFEIKSTYETIRFTIEPFDANKSWNSLINKKAFRIQKYWYIQKWKAITSYAAIFIIAFLSSIAFFYWGNPNNEAYISFCVGSSQATDSINLSDGTSVILTPGTKIKLKNDYGENERIVYLEGEAFFDVAKNLDKPFVVKTSAYEIEALGTKFNVMAYPGDSIFTTTLLEGSVRIPIEAKEKEITLKPNEQLTYNQIKKSVDVHKIDAGECIEWTKGIYYFPEQNLKNIADRLEQLYGVKIIINSEEIGNTSFSGTFKKKQSINEIIDIISYAVPIHYTIYGGKIIINKK